MPSGRRRTCCSPSARRPGRTSSPGRCSPSNCSARRACLRTTPIIGKDSDMRWFLLASLAAMAGAGTFAVASAQDARSDAAALQQARTEAEQANRRVQQLQADSRRATSEADRARIASEALAAQIEAAEADLTASERRIALIAALQTAQRARLAEQQGPVIRLTAALQTMTRRPPPPPPPHPPSLPA